MREGEAGCEGGGVSECTWERVFKHRRARLKCRDYHGLVKPIRVPGTGLPGMGLGGIFKPL
jgi:hypothetical protein